ncbi:MAG: ATP synthase F1 subunit delta [Acidobacteria bacterium]|nr:ATP synthase F1 subunit delta [Acidobacteriota bacterium]MBK9709704.1 ATP synthase F1 subunit delta [Acidobacteriota bacterium]
MSGITIANRYAKALADVMTERKESNEVFAELSRFSSLIAGHSELREVFANPVLALDRKSGVLKELVTRLKLRPTTINFLQLLLNNHRLHNLDQMVRALSRELDQRANIVSAEISTAREISDAEKEMLRDKLKTITGKEVRLTFRADPGIIGGVVTRIGSLIIDGSIKNQLSQMKQRLMTQRA